MAKHTKLSTHAPAADLEMNQRPRRLHAVIFVIGHLNLAHAVGFDAVLHDCAPLQIFS